MLTEEVKNKFKDALRRGAFRVTAASIAGVHKRTIDRFIASKTPEAKVFSRECRDIESSIEVDLLTQQFDAAKGGDVSTGKWLLAIRKPELYSQQREMLREIKRVIAKLEKERELLHDEVLKSRRARLPRKQPAIANGK